jgi:hypothetical protein
LLISVTRTWKRPTNGGENNGSNVFHFVLRVFFQVLFKNLLDLWDPNRPRYASITRFQHPGHLLKASINSKKETRAEGFTDCARAFMAHRIESFSSEFCARVLCAR